MTSKPAHYTPNVFTQVTTNWVDENGNPLKDPTAGQTIDPAGNISGYEYVRTIIDANGNAVHIFRKVSPNPEPVKPTPQAKKTQYKAAQLPNTGDQSSSATDSLLGMATMLGLLGLSTKKRKED